MKRFKKELAITPLIVGILEKILFVINRKTMAGMMKKLEIQRIEKAFLVGTHRFSFRSGEPGEIIGVAFVTPSPFRSRAAFHVRFKDGSGDFCAISDKPFYEIISEADVRKKRIPAVIH